jgi:hypothetical protein
VAGARSGLPSAPEKRDRASRRRRPRRPAPHRAAARSGRLPGVDGFPLIVPASGTRRHQPNGHGAGWRLLAAGGPVRPPAPRDGTSRGSSASWSRRARPPRRAQTCARRARHSVQRYWKLDFKLETGLSAYSHPPRHFSGGCVPRFPLGQLLPRPRDLATHPEGAGARPQTLRSFAQASRVCLGRSLTQPTSRRCS